MPALGAGFRVVADDSRRDCDRCLVKQLPCFPEVWYWLQFFKCGISKTEFKIFTVFNLSLSPC